MSVYSSTCTHTEIIFLHPNSTVFFHTEEEIWCLLLFSLLKISLNFFEEGICKEMCKNFRSVSE